MGWTKGSGVVFTDPGQEQFLNALGDLLPFDIFVTSGTRTPEAQVRAMYVKMDLGGRQELINTYADDNFANAVADAYPDVDEGIAIVEAYNPSSHGIGRAIDLRTRDKSPDEIADMKSAVSHLGGTYLYEPSPPHLHVQIPASFIGGPKKNFLFMLLGGLGLIWIISRAGK